MGCVQAKKAKASQVKNLGVSEVEKTDTNALSWDRRISIPCSLNNNGRYGFKLKVLVLLFRM